ncbi:phospholipase D-like domain-containing protein [bacterium]|nr:phospholipase D-like domain-containing protein [bacterium]
MERMPPKKRCRDLNRQIVEEDRKRQKVHQRGKRKVSILFDGRGIQNAILRAIKREDTAYIVGCVAWLSNKKILKCMAEHLKGVTIITTTDRLTKRKKNQQAYAQLSGCFQGGVIRTVGEGRGKFKSLMHHKFLIGLSAAREPIWLMNGSFNITESALRHIENVMILDDPEIATTFFEEFKRVHRISKPLRIRG